MSSTRHFIASITNDLPVPLTPLINILSGFILSTLSSLEDWTHKMTLNFIKNSFIDPH